jgi:hypothetical protein
MKELYFQRRGTYCSHQYVDLKHLHYESSAGVHFMTVQGVAKNKMLRYQSCVFSVPYITSPHFPSFINSLCTKRQIHLFHLWTPDLYIVEVCVAISLALSKICPDNAKQFKLAVNSFQYFNSFYSLYEYFNENKERHSTVQYCSCSFRSNLLLLFIFALKIVMKWNKLHHILSRF